MRVKLARHVPFPILIPTEVQGFFFVFAKSIHAGIGMSFPLTQMYDFVIRKDLVTTITDPVGSAIGTKPHYIW